MEDVIDIIYGICLMMYGVDMIDGICCERCLVRICREEIVMKDVSKDH